MTKIIALDAGHGLKTAGKQTPDGIKEWTLNDKVRDKVVEFLAGYDVKFIFPDNNEGNTDESLASRLSKYVSAGADVAVSIHHNAFKGVWGDHTGVCTYTDRNYTSEDMRLAQCIQKRLVANTGLKDRGILKENWWVINQNRIPAVLTEGGFMDSRKDYPVITSDAGQAAYAKAIADGLIEYLGLTKQSEPAPLPKEEVYHDYYKEPVAWAIENGITAEKDLIAFKPNDNCTRVQAVTFLWRAAGKPEPKDVHNPFKDVEASAYYYKAVIWAMENGITAGVGDGKFGPDEPCTRAQVVTLLWRSEGERKATNEAIPFKDVGEYTYYHDAVLWAVENGITSGVSKTEFAPEEACTRGQVVTFLHRLKK